MEEDPQSLPPIRRKAAEGTLRKLCGKRFYLWPLLWIPLGGLVAPVGANIAEELLLFFFPYLYAQDTAMVVGACIAGSAVPLFAGFVMGRDYWKAKKTLAVETGSPAPASWKYPLQFAFAQWGLTVLYCLAALTLFFGACVLFLRGVNFH